MEIYTSGQQTTSEQQTTSATKIIAYPICPDLLEYRDLGAADNMRGRVIRAFFWLMRWWPR